MINLILVNTIFLKSKSTVTNYVPYLAYMPISLFTTPILCLLLWCKQCLWFRSPYTSYLPPTQQGTLLDCVWNVTAHVQKLHFIFRRNGRVDLNRRGRQFSRLLAAEVCASAVIMMDAPGSEVVKRGRMTRRMPYPCRSHGIPMPFPRHAVPLIHTCHAAPLPCSDNAVSFVKVRVVAGNIGTASPTDRIFVVCCYHTLQS